MGKVFVLLAGYTPLNVLGDPVIHSWPGEIIFGLSDCLISAWVPHCGVVMDQGYQVTFLHFGGLPNGYGLYEFFWG
jgi:hypothetical protein